MFAQLFPLRKPFPLPPDVPEGLLGFVREKIAEMEKSAEQLRFAIIALLIMGAISATFSFLTWMRK